MKKRICLLLIACLIATMLSSCILPFADLDEIFAETTESTTTEAPDSPEDPADGSTTAAPDHPTDPGDGTTTTAAPDHPADPDGDATTTTAAPDDGGDDPDGDGTTTTAAPDGDAAGHLYADFTEDEKALMDRVVGLVIPFVPNDEYYVEEYEEDGEVGVNFYTFGNTEAEFEAYRALFSGYTDEGTGEDDYGDTWYFYAKGDVWVDLSFYYYEGEYVIDVYVYLPEGSGDGILPDDPTAPEINYGTLTGPVSTSYAHTVCSTLPTGGFSASPFYVQGTVTRVGEDKGNHYKNVSFTDGTTEMLIYTIDLSDEITSFAVGDTIVAYGYIKNHSGEIEMATYNSTVYVRVVAIERADGEQGGGGSSGHTYTDFTSTEKSLFESVVGTVIPFLPTNEYGVEEYTYEDEVGVNFYTFDNTASEFAAYRALFADYTYDGSSVDDYGDTWYCYSKGDVYVDMGFYVNEDGDNVVDVYVYVLTGNTEGGDGSGDGSDVGGGGTDTNDNVMTNDGKGLPQSATGIYDVDFTKGSYVQNVTDQGYYLDGCPTTGSPAVLVIPVEFSDATAADRGYTTADLEKIFNGTDGDTSYYSLHDYFYLSSYGQLDPDITVVDWFRPANTSTYYEQATQEYNGDEIAIGDQLIMDEALAYLSTVMDLSEFDSDNNGVIDAVVMVNTLDIGEENFHWAYRYWNLYTDDDGYYYEYDGVSANDYIWMSYEFMFEDYDENGDVNYDTSNPLNPYTFIHEFSHILGADDYYDTEYKSSPLGGYDVMDSMAGDHNPYSKFNYGWITESRLAVTDSTVSVTLTPFAESGDTLILANNWDESLGAYQEYYVIMYYTAGGLNAGIGGYFDRDCIVVYHVNASLYAEEYDSKTYYDVYNSNTDASSEHGTVDNLIELVQSGAGHNNFVTGDSLPTLTDDAGNALGYTFTVDAITADGATLTVTKR